MSQGFWGRRRLVAWRSSWVPPSFYQSWCSEEAGQRRTTERDENVELVVEDGDL